MVSRHFWLWPNLLSSMVHNSSILIITTRMQTAFTPNNTGQAAAAGLGPSQLTWDTWPHYFFNALQKCPPGDEALAQRWSSLEPRPWYGGCHGLTALEWLGESGSMQVVSDGGGHYACWCGCQAAWGGTCLGEHPSWPPWLPAAQPSVLHTEVRLTMV